VGTTNHQKQSTILALQAEHGSVPWVQLRACAGLEAEAMAAAEVPRTALAVGDLQPAAQASPQGSR
jgi:hypothetical protein